MSNKLSTEDLTILNQLNTDYYNVVYSLGEITAQIEQQELKLAELNESKRNYLSTYIKLQAKDQELAQTFTQKYGAGQINLQTGEITGA